MNYEIPRLNANEDQLHLVKLCVAAGDCVKEGQPLFIVESTKASFEVVADQPETVSWVNASVGRLLDVGTTVVRTGDGAGASTAGTESTGAADAREPTAPKADPGKADRAGDGQPDGASGDAGNGASASDKRRLTAKERLQQRREAEASIQPGVTPGQGLSASGTEPGDAGRHGRANSNLLPARGISPATSPAEAAGDLPWVRAMRERLAAAVPALPAERTWAGPLAGPLSEPGLHLEPGAAIEAGARLVARRAWVGRDTRIAVGVTLHAGDLIIGARVKVLRDTDLFSGEILVEDGALISSRVQGDVSGGMNPDSRLIVGGAAVIGSEAFLNTCHEILIEREAAVSPRAMLFTHSFWQSVLDGYHPLFGPIRIREQAWVGAGCQVLPGITVGAGSIVSSNSTVVADVRPGTLVAGIPARETRTGLKRELPDPERAQILTRLVAEFARLAEARGCTVHRSQDGLALRVERADVAGRDLVCVPGCPEAGGDAERDALRASQSASQPNPTADTVLLWDRNDPAPAAGSTFNLRTHRFTGSEDRVTHLLRNFLRRQGIRFQPYDWDGDFNKGL